MDKIMEIIEKIGTRNLIFAGIGLVVLIVFLFVYRGLRIRKYRKLIVDVENKMNAVKSLPLQYRLGRVQSISKNMPEVSELYEQYAQEFERICEYQKNELGILVNEVDEQLFYGKLRKVSKKMKQLDEMLIVYEKDSQELLEKIEKITEIENVQRIEIIRVKEMYRETIDHFESIRFKVEEFVPNLLDIFNEIDDSFVKLEGMMNNQLFEDAKEFTKDIEAKVIWVNQRLEDLPSYIAVVRQYMPKKVAHIQGLIQIMTEEKFSLNQLDAYNRLNMIQTTLEESIGHIKKLELELIPKDPNDNKNVIMEIRGAAGGDEGNIFAGDLYRMYVKYAESQGWKVEVMEAEESEAGGFSLISFNVIGDGVYGKLKYESGSHRVQRVPKTETQGRVHTSTATVLVMPEMEEVDVQINKSDLRIDTYRASGAGGQHINKTDSAVRITHLPTGIVATSQDGRSQHDNRDKAMKALVARVYDYFQSQQTEAIDSERKSKVGTGDRAEKIRTYNYPQNRVTDHRIGLTIQQLDRIIEGKLDDIITALINEDQRLKLEGQK